MPKVFVSWSGADGRLLAEAVKETLLRIDVVDAWVSSRDIVPGSEWFASIKSHLNEVDAALICLTPEALKSPWVHFEAGALWSRLREVKVLVFGVESSELQRTPIAQIQVARGMSESDVVRLLASLPDMPDETTVRGHVAEVWEEWSSRVRGAMEPWHAGPDEGTMAVSRLGQELLSSFAVLERHFRVFEFKLYSEVHGPELQRQRLDFDLALNGYLKMRSDTPQTIRTAYDASLLFSHVGGTVDAARLESAVKSAQRVLNFGLDVGLHGRFEPWDTFVFLAAERLGAMRPVTHEPYVNVFLIGQDGAVVNLSPHTWMDQVLRRVASTWPGS